MRIAGLLRGTRKLSTEPAVRWTAPAVETSSSIQAFAASIVENRGTRAIGRRIIGRDSFSGVDLLRLSPPRWELLILLR